MPLTTIYPTSTTNDTDMPANGGSGSDALGDGSDGSWIEKQGYVTDSHIAYADAAAGAVGDVPGSASAIASVQPIARAKAVGGNPSGNSGFNLQGGFRIGGVNYNAFGQNVKQLDEPSGVIQEFNGTTYTVNPNTGLAWTVADVNGMGWFAGANGYNFDGDDAYVLQLRFVVDYSVASPSTGKAQGAIIVG